MEADTNFNTLVDPDPIFSDTSIFPIQPATVSDYDNYCDSVPSGHPPCEKFQWYCTRQGGRFTLVGWSFNDFIGSSTVNERCGGVGGAKQISLNIGDSPANAGANIFRYEYRNWVNMHRLKWDIPTNYIPASSFLYEQYFNLNDAMHQQNSTLNANNLIITTDSILLDYSYVDSVYQNGVDFNASPCGNSCNNFSILVKPDDDYFEQLNNGFPFLPGCNVPDSTKADFYQEMDFIPSSGSPNFTNEQPWGFYADTVFWAHFSSFFDTSTYSRHDTLIYKYKQRPAFIINSPDTINGYHSPECHTFTVHNTQTSSNGDASHAWLAFRSDSCVSIISLTIDSVTYPNPVADSLYYFNGTFSHDSSRNVTVCFNYNCTAGCASLRNLYFFVGWDCNRTATTVATLTQYNDTLGCSPEKDTVVVAPSEAQFSAALSATTTSPTVCDTIEYNLRVTSTSFGSLYHIVVTDTLPCSTMTYLSNSAEFIFANDTISAEPDTSSSGGAQILSWTIDSISSYILANGLEGFLFNPSHSSLIIHFGIETGCGACLQHRGIAHVDFITNCGVAGMWRRNFNPLIDSTNALFNDLSDTLSVDTLNACSNRYGVTVHIFNLNSNTLRNNNYLEVMIPSGFAPDSFNISPDNIVGQTITWQLDSISPLTFQLALDSGQCGLHSIIANLFVHDTLQCHLADTCFINELANTDTILFGVPPPDSVFACPTDTILCLEPDTFVAEGLCGYFVWDFGDSTATATGPLTTHTYSSAGTYTVTLTVYGNGSSAIGCSASSTCTVVVDCPDRLCGGFCTYPMSLWGNNNPVTTRWRDSVFSSAFPSDLIVGCSAGYSITFTSGPSVNCFLPTTNGDTLPLVSNHSNPKCVPPFSNNGCIPPPLDNIKNELIGETVTLTLNIYYDLNIPSFSASPYHLAFLHVIGPPIVNNYPTFNGQSVINILQLADSFIGGCISYPYASTPLFNMLPHSAETTLTNVIKAINTSFNHCQPPFGGNPNTYDCLPSHGHMMSLQMNPQNGNCLNGLTAGIVAAAFDGTLPYTYLWSTGDTTYSIGGIADGTYTVTVIDADSTIVTAEATVKTSEDICCKAARSAFPQFPDSSNLVADSSYNVNSELNNPIIFYDSLGLSSTKLHMMEGVQLVVEYGATLYLKDCELSACGSMWKGIVVKDGGTLIVNACSIKDAENAIYAEDGSKIYIYDSHFADNVVGFETAINYAGDFNDIDFVVLGTTFDFSGTLHTPYPGQLAYGTKPRAGIEFHNMMGTIGDDTYTENNFAYMNCGIICYSSDLAITNNRFRNFQNEEFYSDDFMGSGIAAVGGDGAYSARITPYVGQNSANATFANCDYGVFGENNTDIKVANCSMDSVITGIYVQECNNKNSINLEYDTISASYAGINSYYNEGANFVYAGYSIIKTTSDSGICVIASEPGSGENNLIIEENYLTCDSSLGGIYLSGCYAPWVFHNTVEETTGIIKGFTGINILGGYKPTVSCNTVIGLSEDGDYGTLGIRVNVTENAVLHCNSTTLTTFGIAFFGLCPTEDNIKDNEMNEHVTGLFLNSNAIISQQKHCGNLWFGPFSSGYGANNTNVSGGVSVTASLFIVHEDSVTDYYPPLPAYDSTWFQVDDTGTPYSCADESECPDKSSERSMALGPESLDNSIANNYTLSLDFIPETKSMARQFLYKRLTDIPALLDSSTALSNFYSAYSDSSVKHLQGVRDSIAQMRRYADSYSDSYHAIDSSMNALLDSIFVLDSLMNSDSLNASAYVALKGNVRAQANILQSSMISLKAQMKSVLSGKIASVSNANSSISSDHIPESNEKIINDVYLATVAVGNYYLDEAQTSEVFDIAQQCPFSGGKAVYRARTLYKLVDATMRYDDDSICFVAGIYRMNQASSKQIEEGTIQLIPNPANDNVAVIYQATSDGPCELFVSDVTGKVVKRISIPCDKTRFEFSVSDINNGLYLVYILNGGESIGRSKLGIIR